MNKAFKIKILEIKVKPVSVYGDKTWPMTETDIKRWNTCERKILLRINRPVAD
jgi:hypothetical protein